jgi:hypothetical protein
VLTAALQAYADRGVFRGFRATPGRGGATDYAFVWLAPRPMRARSTGSGGRLDFPALFPGVPARTPLARDLSAAVGAAASAAVPAHKRLDRRRVVATSGVRGNAWSCALAIRGANQAYAVRAGLALVNDLWLLLRERYPEYLSGQFGLSAE